MDHSGRSQHFIEHVQAPGLDHLDTARGLKKQQDLKLQMVCISPRWGFTLLAIAPFKQIKRNRKVDAHL